MNFIYQKKNERLIFVGFVISAFGVKGALRFNYTDKKNNLLLIGLNIFLKNLKNKVKTKIILLFHKDIMHCSYFFNQNYVKKFIESKVFVFKKKNFNMANNKIYLVKGFGIKCYINNNTFGIIISFSKIMMQFLVKIKLLNNKIINIPFIKPILKYINKHKAVFNLPSNILDIAI